MKARRRVVILFIAAALLGASGWIWAEMRFPVPQFDSPYTLPAMTTPLPRPTWRDVADVAALVVALSLATWILLGRRSRKGMAVLSVASLAYFGFYRGGCICPIGAIQNVTLGVVDPTYYLPFTAVVFFALPLVFALFFGRVFCGGVCPLGAVQDVVLIKPLHIPTWLQHALGVIPFFYLGAAVLLAATDTMFIICRYDPFVPFFRMTGPFHMLVAGGLVLIAATFIGRPYCRFLCPYGAALSVLSRASWKRVTITPDKCIVCTLCEDACPFGAIHPPTRAEEPPKAAP